jgi:hypothetical protein
MNGKMYALNRRSPYPRHRRGDAFQIGNYSHKVHGHHSNDWWTDFGESCIALRTRGNFTPAERQKFDL